MTERPNSASTNGLRSAHLGPPPPPPPRGDERPNASDSGRLSVSPPTGGAPPSESDEEPGEWSSEKSPEPSEGRDSGRMDSGDFGQSPPSAYRTTSLDSYKGREHRERSRGPDRDRDYRHRDFDRERGRDRDRERDRERERERERARRYDGGDRARDRRYEGHRDRPRDYDRNGSSRHGHSDLYREREREHPPSRRRASGYDRDESLSGHGSGGAALQSPGTTGWSSSTTPHHASSRYHSRRSRSPRDYTSGSSRPTSPHRLAMDRHHPFSYIGDNRRFSTTPPPPPPPPVTPPPPPTTTDHYGGHASGPSVSVKPNIPPKHRIAQRIDEITTKFDNEVWHYERDLLRLQSEDQTIQERIRRAQFESEYAAWDVTKLANQMDLSAKQLEEIDADLALIQQQLDPPPIAISADATLP